MGRTEEVFEIKKDNHKHYERGCDGSHLLVQKKSDRLLSVSIVHLFCKRFFVAGTEKEC